MIDVRISTRPHHTAPEDFTVYRCSIFENEQEKFFVEDAVNVGFISKQSEDIQLYIYNEVITHIKNKLEKFSGIQIS